MAHTLEACLCNRERVNAADNAGPWATVGVLVEKSKPTVSSKGDMYSRWKLSDLDGELICSHSISVS